MRGTGSGGNLKGGTADGRPDGAALVRSFLFVPGSRPDRFDAALSAGADMVCVDLEDAVAPPLKAAARPAGVSFLAAAPRPLRALRINPVSTRDGLVDLLALVDAAPAAGHLVLPKVDGADEVRLASAVLARAGVALPVIALVESADGLANVERIAAAPGLVGLLFGAVDLAAELGCALEDEPLLYARSRIVHAARRAGVAAIDVPTLDFRDLDVVAAEASRARVLGFTGKAVIHPSNVAAVNAAFTPSAVEVERARRVVAAFRESATGLAVVDGKLVEAPVVKAMERVLTLAGELPDAA